ncbi:hypothetical protein ACP275_06G110300 [Erythranthe tilingii]
MHLLFQILLSLSLSKNYLLDILCSFLKRMGKRRENEEEGDNKKKKRKGRIPCCEKDGVRRGAWTNEEDKILVDFISLHGHGTWRNLPQLAGLLRCGKSCRLRWNNYLRPDIKRGPFSPDEENTITRLQSTLGNKWAAIASHLPGRTDNDIKNFWNSHLRKSLAHASSKSGGDTSLSQPCHSSTTTTPPLLLQTPPGGTTTATTNHPGGDYFIRLWNSEIGESFRDGATVSHSHSPASQASNAGLLSCKKELGDDDDVAACYSSKSYEELDDSSEAMLKLLLDFPVGGDDMEFLQGPVGDALNSSHS